MLKFRSKFINIDHNSFGGGRAANSLLNVHSLEQRLAGGSWPAQTKPWIGWSHSNRHHSVNLLILIF